MSGEERIAPNAWSQVDGCYYIQLQVTSYSKFYIEKNDSILPVNRLSVSAERSSNNTANITWRVANEINVKNYSVQYDEDGINYKDGCTIAAGNMGEYVCTVSVGRDKKYFFKVKEIDHEDATTPAKQFG